ncbi:protein croquemort isoform X2 [Nasonia vitripennis]|uniref:Uncharacterized protein n=1 Tax=Nasonia vitripennis TaxID=7425 RepID=A0A7M7G5X2_NASVI|nr:protein croquemort isoform X2 [Nasonia vitripennis]
MASANEGVELEKIERDESSKTPAGTKEHLFRKKKESEKMVRLKKKIGIMVLVAFFAIVLGGTAGFLWPSFFMDILKKELILSPTSTSFKMWQQTPVPMHLKIYMYNWTNYDQVAEYPRIKPNFVQMGPYVFREVDTKVNKKWNDNGTVTFQQRRVWHFLPELSNGALTDKVTNLNPVAATVAYTFRNSGSFKRTLIDKVLKRMEQIAITKTVNELLFTGYDDLLLKLAVEFKLTDLPYEKFAFFYARNGSDSYDGTFNMLTGSKNIYDLGMLKEWKFSDTSKYYSKSCGEIKGTNGDLWPPLNNNKTVSVFSPDVCTTLSLKAAGTGEWMGLTGSKFVSDEDMFDNGTNVEANKCRCEGVECQPSGTLNVSSCKYGAPAFVSLPHFYLADESYRQNITGMKPNKEDHEFLLILEPSSGIPMQVRASLQINFLVQQEKKLPYFKDLPGMYVPMLWFTQEVNLTAEYAKQVKLLILLPPLGSGITFGIAAIGVLLVIIAIFLFVRQKLEDGETELLVPKDNVNGNKDTVVINSTDE